MTNNKQQNPIDWLSNQFYELLEQYSEGKFDRAMLNELMLEATYKAKEMEVAGKEMSYADDYKEGYNRAIELTKWAISNLIPPHNEQNN